jgi:FkbM family methyltransferase
MFRDLYVKLCRRIAHRYDGLALKLHRAAVIYIDAYTNTDFNFRVNGEMRVLERILPLLGDKPGQAPPIVFDVGCNTGEWSELALKRRGDIRLYGFELAPALQEVIARRLGHVPNFTLCRFGLSDKAETVSFAFVPENPVLTSLVKDLPRRGAGHTAYKTEIVEGRVMRADDYCREQGIDRIGFLKVDVEGHEVEVLDGFGTILTERRADVVQFEFGFEAYITGRTVRQFINRFMDAGYVVGRVLTVGVAFSEQGEQFQRLAFGDYVAVLKERTDLIKALSPDRDIIYDP